MESIMRVKRSFPPVLTEDDFELGGSTWKSEVQSAINVLFAADALALDEAKAKAARNRAIRRLHALSGALDNIAIAQWPGIEGRHRLGSPFVWSDLVSDYVDHRFSGTWRESVQAELFLLTAASLLDRAERGPDE
jgi:hypothetical protein